MSNIWRAQVNQKLYFAQLLLVDARALAGAPQMAMLEGVAFHLVTAYRLYLKEIVAYQRQTTDGVDARSARRQLALQGAVFQELEELARLEKDNLWPARLLSAYREIVGESVIVGESAKSVASKISASAIAISDITEQADANTYQLWLEQFRKLIEIHRDAAQEW